MSIQFRSRIRTVANYEAFGLSDLGICCTPGAASDEATCRTYQSCIEESGWWRGLPQGDTCEENSVVEGWTCPDLSDLGCCCNCSLLTGDTPFEDFYEAYAEAGNHNNIPNGTRNMTYCECMDIGGNWTEQTCDEIEGLQTNPPAPDGGYAPLCMNGLTDIRFPSACCSDGGCIDVCTPQDCVDLEGTSVWVGRVCSQGPSAYGGDTDPADFDCQVEDGGSDPDLCFDFSANCGTAFNRSASANESNVVGQNNKIRTQKTQSGNDMMIISSGFDSDDIKPLYDKLLRSGDVVSACVEVVGQNTVCTQKPKNECSGVWMTPLDDSMSRECTSTETIELIENMNKNYLTRSRVNGWSLGQQVNIEKNVSGRYFGEFIPASRKEGNGSLCYGTPRGYGKSGNYNATSMEEQVGIINGSIREATKRYAIIVQNTDVGYDSPFGKYNNKYSSRWDTKSNKKTLKTVNHVMKMNDKHSKWYIPSQDLLARIVQQLKDPTLKSNLKTDSVYNQWHHFKLDRYYWTSTASVDGIYAQKVNSLFPEQQETKACKSSERHFTRLVYLIEIVD